MVSSSGSSELGDPKTPRRSKRLIRSSSSERRSKRLRTSPRNYNTPSPLSTPSPRSAFHSSGSLSTGAGAYKKAAVGLRSIFDLFNYDVKHMDRVYADVKAEFSKRRTEGQDDMTDYNVWKQYQYADEAKFLCYRPPFAKPPLPLPLVCRAFAKFKCDVAEGVLEDVDIQFAERFWMHLHDDSYVTNHKQAVSDMIYDLIGLYVGASVIAYLKLGGEVEADGLLVGRHLVKLALEFKAQAGRSGEPDFQVLEYFFRASKLFKNPCRQYGLAISLLGPRLEVFGVTEEGGKVWAEPFAETKCYGPDEYLLATARIWRAVRLFVQEYQEVPLQSPPVPWPLSMHTSVESLVPGRRVFRYVNEGGALEVAKFVTRYDLEAHKAWLPHAPELRSDVFCEHGVKMIRMEYLSPEDGWIPADEVVRNVKDDAAQLNKVSECIGVALDVGHSKGFVHGDLRLYNILLKPKSGCPFMYDVKFIDFEWAGAAGEATYPLMNRAIRWPPGACYGAVITKQHDIYFKDNLADQLE